MQINQEITMHLDRKALPAVVDTVQGETARSVTLRLYDKEQPWPVPADASILIRYRKEDLTGGVYDSMPDGSRAWEILDNAVTVRIAPQALATAGVTAMQIAIVAEGEELASFIFHLRVESDPIIGTLASDDYINIGQWLMPRIYQFVSQAEAAAAAAIRAAEEAVRTATGVSSRYEPQFAICALDPVDGQTVPNENALASAPFPLLGKQVGVAFSTLVTVRLFYYSEDLAFLGADLTRTASFETDIPAGAKFARVEIRYAAGFAVDEPEKLANYVTVYIPNTSAEDADRAEAAASQAYQSAQEAANATKNCVRTVNGVYPDENGNVAVSGGGSTEPLKYLQLDQRKLQSYDIMALYNGTEFQQGEIPLGFSCIEPNAFNGQSNILQDHLPDMPAMLRGTFKATAASEEEYNFTYAYAFSGGYAEGAFTHCVVIDPGTGKIWHFDFASGSVKTTAIGENGGGSSGDTYRLAKSITLEEDVSSIVITTDDDGNLLNFSEGYMECLNPKTDANCQAYIWITGEYGNLQNKSFGYVSATAIDVKTFWWFNRLGEKLLLRTSTSNSSINALNDYTYPNLLDIGNITGIEIRTDGANRFLIKTGATLKLYVKE